jgi:hypothetical protein
VVHSPLGSAQRKGSFLCEFFILLLVSVLLCRIAS